MTSKHFLAACVLVFAATASAQPDDKKDQPDQAKLIVGKWEVTKTDTPDDPPVGSTFEFAKHGTMKITKKRGTKDEVIRGAYKIKDNQLHYTLKDKDKDEDCEKHPLTIKKLTEKELKLEDGKDSKNGFIEFKRLK